MLGVFRLSSPPLRDNHTSCGRSGITVITCVITVIIRASRKRDNHCVESVLSSNTPFKVRRIALNIYTPWNENNHCLPSCQSHTGFFPSSRCSRRQTRYGSISFWRCDETVIIIASSQDWNKRFVFRSPHWCKLWISTNSLSYRSRIICRY